MAPRECPTKETLSIPSRSMSATRSAVWAGMPALPSTLPVAPRPRRSTARNRQAVSPSDSSSSTSARKASARPVRPWTSRAVSCASGSPQEKVLRSAVASDTGISPLWCGSGLFELAGKDRFRGAHARFLGEPFQGDAYLLVAAGIFGHAHVERLSTLVVHREGARAHASPLFPEPQLVVFVLLRSRQPPDLQLRPGVGVFFLYLELSSRPGREFRRFQGGGGDLVSREKPRRVQQHSKHGEHAEDGRRRHERNPARFTARHPHHDAVLELGWRGLRGAGEVHEAFVGEAEIPHLVPALRATFEVLLGLPFLLRPEGAHHVGPEEVAHLRMFAHRRLTHPRPCAWSRAARAARPSSGS